VTADEPQNPAASQMAEPIGHDPAVEPTPIFDQLIRELVETPPPSPPTDAPG
jgi:hypothetical protein